MVLPMNFPRRSSFSANQFSSWRFRMIAIRSNIANNKNALLERNKKITNRPSMTDSNVDLVLSVMSRKLCR